jgi:hypothetical protein
MARLNDIMIKIEIEPLVKLTCNAINCRHNLARKEGGHHCNFKHVVLMEGGRCEHYISLPRIRPVEREGVMVEED